MRNVSTQEAETLQYFLSISRRFSRIGNSPQEKAAFDILSSHLKKAEIDAQIPESQEFQEQIAYLRPVFLRETMRLFESIVADRNMLLTAVTLMRLINSVRMAPISWYSQEKKVALITQVTQPAVTATRQERGTAPSNGKRTVPQLERVPGPYVGAVLLR